MPNIPRRCLPHRAGLAALVIVSSVSSFVPVRVSAQALPPDPAEGARMQAGPFYFRPTLDVTNIGVDSNVFNDQESPKSDFSATISPALQAIVRGGPARVVYTSRLDYVWFQKYSSERSANSRSDGRFELRFTRLVPFVSGTLVETRERPNAEIDLRARRRELHFGTGAALAIGPASVVAIALRQHNMNYAPDQTFRGVSLEEELDETLRAVDAELRVDLSPLTTFSMKGTLERQAFDFSPGRDSRSIMISPALEFNPSALISGKLMVGYRTFNAADPLLPDFRGVTAQADLGYVLGATTRIQGRLLRDVQYSFEPQHPYYITFGGQATLTQQIAGPFDVQAMAGRQRLRYRRRGLTRDPTLTVDMLGGGVGVRVGENSHLGVNVDFTWRRGGEELPGRDYDRRRVVGSFSYGF